MIRSLAVLVAESSGCYCMKSQAYTEKISYSRQRNNLISSHIGLHLSGKQETRARYETSVPTIVLSLCDSGDYDICIQHTTTYTMQLLTRAKMVSIN